MNTLLVKGISCVLLKKENYAIRAGEIAQSVNCWQVLHLILRSHVKKSHTCVIMVLGRKKGHMDPDQPHLVVEFQAN